MKKVSLKMTDSNPFRFVKSVVVITVFSILACSCSNDDNHVPIQKEEHPVTTKEISQEIKELIFFKGNENASSVLISIPGGPSTEFDTSLVNLIFENFTTTDLLTVNVHQVQTLDSTRVKGNDLTLEQAVGLNSESIEMLDKVISYFKEQDRTVYVFGLSFGSFIVQDLIAKKGVDTADKYLMMLGRLDMNDAIWQAASEGKEAEFENGVTPILFPDPLPVIKERNLLRISAGFARNRYTQLLNTIEDLSNLTYIYGATDNAVGSLTADEVQFLKSKNANILTGNGGHDEPFVGFFEQGLKDAFGIELLP